MINKLPIGNLEWAKTQFGIIIENIIIEKKINSILLKLKPLTLLIPGFGRGWFSQGGALSAPPLEINEGVSGEQDSLNTIFNTHKIRIVCKIWSSYFIVHARARSF